MLEDSAALHSQWNKVACVPADFLKFCTEYVTLAVTSKEGGTAAGRYKTSSESLCIVFFRGFLQVATFRNIVVTCDLLYRLQSWCHSSTLMFRVAEGPQLQNA